MELIALGACGAYPLPDMGTSCYLVKSDVNLVFDFGATALSRIEKFCKIEELDGIFLSHFHSDHISDIFTLRYHNFFKSGKKLNVYMLEDDSLECAMIGNIDCFNVTYFDVGSVVEIGETKIEVVRSSHVGKAVGFVISHNGKSIYYTADTKLSESVKYFAKTADVLLCDCFADTAYFNENMPHMSVSDVNSLAKICKGKTIATHLYPTRISEIEKELQGVEIIEEQKVYEI
ncbi:MAG: MBL fold metallo-hydrolase [Clostridia bacterium]